MKQLIQHINPSFSSFRAPARKLLLLLTVLLVGAGEVWSGTVTLRAKTNSVSASPSGLEFTLSGDYIHWNPLVDYTYTGSGEEAKLSWTVPSGYTISVSKITIYAQNDRIWDWTKWKVGKGQYRTFKNTSYSQFCNSNSWNNYTLNSSSYFPLGNNGYVQIKAIDRELRYKDIVFTYTLKYSINFNGNGATSGSMSPQTLEYGVAANLNSNQFGRTNFTFVGWNTKADGTGTPYSDGQEVTNLTPGTTLYAQWRSNYSVAFNGNGATRGSMSNQAFVYGTAQNLKSNEFSKTDVVTFNANGGTCGTTSISKSATFDGWATSPTGAKMYDDGQSVNNLTTTAGATVTLYAHWSQNNSITLPNATKPSHVLAGWSIDGTAEHIVGEAGDSYAVPLNGSTLTAIWIPKYTPVITGSNTSMKVGDQQTDAFYFEHVYNPQVHITLVSIDPINNGDGQVIEYDAVNNKIIAHNAGVAKIYFTQAETATINAFTSATYTYTVSKQGNNLVAAISDNSLLVEGTATASFTNQDNTGTAINVSITNEVLTRADLAQTVNGTKPVITYSNGVITAQNAGTARITFSQPETNKYTASASYSFDVTVNKVGNTLSTSLSATSLLVDGTSMATFTGRNNSGTIDVNITNESLTNGALAREISGSKPVITYSNGVITGQNAGTARITFSQPETYKYTAYSQYFDININKYSNTITISGVRDMTYADAENISITSTNNNGPDYDVSQTSGATVATYSSTGKHSGTISSTYNSGPASWSVTQAEDYKYSGASATISLNVNPSGESVCYLVDESGTEHDINGSPYVRTWDNEIEGVAGLLTFDGRRSWSGNGSITVASKDINGGWTNIYSVSGSPTSGVLEDYYKSFSKQLSESCMGLSFSDAGYLAKHVQNIKVTRRTFLRAKPYSSAPQDQLSPSLIFGTTLEGNQITRQFYVEWSSSNTGDILLSSNNPHFTVSPTVITNTDCASGRTLVTVTYLADEHPEGTDITHNGTITIYDKGRVREVTVTGTTQPQYDLVVSGQNKSIQVEDDLNLSDIITYSYEGNYSVVPADPTHGEGTSPFYFTINIDSITSNQDNCKVPNAVVTYDAGTKKFHACNAGKVTITFTQTDENPAVHAGMKVGGVHRDNVSYTITVSKHDPTFTWTLHNAEWGSQYKFSFSSDNEATPWSAVSNTDIAVYRSSTDSIYTNYRSGAATFTVTQEENFKYNRKDSTVTTNVQHGVERTCYLYESPENQEIKVWDFVQATWQDTAVAGKVIFEAKRGPDDKLDLSWMSGLLSALGWQVGADGVVELHVNEFVNGNRNEVTIIRDQVRSSFTHYEIDLNRYANGLSFKDDVPEVIGKRLVDYTNRVKNVKVTRLPWIKASDSEITLPTIGKHGESQAIVEVYWSGVAPLRIELKNNNPHFTVIPDEYFIQETCTSGSSVLTIKYHSDEAIPSETDTIVIYDHALKREIVLHGATEDKGMQRIVWNQSFNPILAENGTIDADSILTAYAVDEEGEPTRLPISYSVGNTSIARIENGNHLHIVSIGRTIITATVAGDQTHSGATATLVLNVLDGNGCGSYAFERAEEVNLFTITSDEALAVTKPAEDLYFQAYRDWWVIANPSKQQVHVRYKVAGDDEWKTQDEKNGQEINTGGLSAEAKLYGPFRLPENTVGIQFYTKFGAYGNMHVKDVFITQRTYLLKDKDELEKSILVNNLDTIGEFTVEYSDKPKILVTHKHDDVTLHVDKPSPNSCGDAGKYTYTVTCLSDTIGVIKDTIIITSTLKDDTLLIPVTIIVGVDGEFFFDNGYDNDTTHTDWNESQYWRKDEEYNHGHIPTMASMTTIEGPTVIDYDAYAYQMTITGAGKVTIAPTGSLRIGAGGIVGANMNNLVLQASQSGEKKGQTGVLRMYPGIIAPQATVQFFSTIANAKTDKEWLWQYIGTPIKNPDTNEHIFYQCWLFEHNTMTDAWTNAGNWGHMEPFRGYAFTRDNYRSTGPLFGICGQLNQAETKVLSLAYKNEGGKEFVVNQIANSWAAPIRLSCFVREDFKGIEPYLFYYPKEGKGSVTTIGAFTSKYTEDDVFPAMQGFFVKTREAAEHKLVLDYKRLVWEPEAEKSFRNEPLKAASRERNDNDELLSRVRIDMMSADSIPDHLYLLEKEGEGFSREFTEGYDAPKYFVDGLPCIYTYETSGPHLAVSATDDVVGTYLAINTGASRDYTLTFSKVIGEGLGLRDLVTNTIVPITEGMQYAFTAPANSSPMLRFVVVEHEETPQWNNNNGTSLEDVGGEFKIWQSGEILSVVGAGSHASLRLYDAAGKLILSEFFNEATAINLNALPTGVYMVQVNDKTEKVLR